jgi:hypothetical protein
MKTTIEISLMMAIKAYDAITDNRFLEENVINDFPNTWTIEQEDEELHDRILIELVEQLTAFGISENEYQTSQTTMGLNIHDKQN